MEELWAIIRSYLGGIYLPEIKYSRNCIHPLPSIVMDKDESGMDPAEGYSCAGSIYAYS